MLDLRRAPARPGQAVIVALARAVLGPQRDEVEVLLVRHVQLQPLGRLAAVAGRPAAAVHLAQDVLGQRALVLDLDVLEHLVGEAELLGEQVHDLDSRPSNSKIGLTICSPHCSERLDATREPEVSNWRADRQQVGAVLAPA